MILHSGAAASGTSVFFFINIILSGSIHVIYTQAWLRHKIFNSLSGSQAYPHASCAGLRLHNSQPIQITILEMGMFDDSEKCRWTLSTKERDEVIRMEMGPTLPLETKFYKISTNITIFLLTHATQALWNSISLN